jgi:hypothetical protein
MSFHARNSEAKAHHTLPRGGFHLASLEIAGDAQGTSRMSPEPVSQ